MSRISEQFFTEGFTEDRIDEAAGVIKRVRILGKESKNGRTYSKAAMQTGRGLYEGAEVNIDHARDEPTSRDFAEGFGEIRAVTYQEKGDDYWLEGDLHYLKSHPMAPRVVERARRFPEKVGLSHVIDGTSNRVNGKTNVESIDSVISVDVVTRPATNKSFFESEDDMATDTKPKKTTIRKLLEAAWPGRKYADLIEEAEDAAGMSPTAPVEAPAEAVNSEDAVKAAFRAMVVAAFDDEKLDAKATVKRISDILKSQEKLMGGGAPAAQPADGGGSGGGSEGPKAEATEKRLERLERLFTEREEKAECRELLAEANVKETPERLKLLRKAAEADRPALVESWKGADGTTQESDDDWGALGGRRGKPKTSAPKFEGLGADEDLEDEETDEPSRKGGKRDLKSYMESLTE